MFSFTAFSESRSQAAPPAEEPFNAKLGNITFANLQPVGLKVESEIQVQKV